MNRLRDILYDKNDILVAFVIILIAAFIITSRINVILSYPSSLSAGSSTNVEEPAVQPSTTPDDSNAEVPAKADDKKIDNSVSSDPVNHSVYIEAGSTGQQIADILVGLELMESRQEFYNAVAAAGADTKLQAGTFTIPSTATPEEVVAIITR